MTKLKQEQRNITHLKLDKIVTRFSKNGAHIYLPKDMAGKLVSISIAGEYLEQKRVSTSIYACHVYVPKKYIGKIATITIIDPNLL